MNFPDYESWCKRDLWQLRDAAQLLVRLEPVINPKQTYNVVRPERKCREQYINSHKKYAVFKNVMAIAKEAIAIETLKPYRDAEKYSAREEIRVFPKDFLIWAKEKEFDIPEELLSVLESDRPQREQWQEKNKKWGYLHDTKLLEIARWVLEQYWEGKDVNKAPSKDAIVAELVDKYGLTKNEAGAVDLVTRHDDRRNAMSKKTQ